MSERMDGWRECADPVELAAAVAAGVEVLCVAVDGRTWETGCEDSESFRRCMANGCRYRVPPSWSWSYEPPTDVPTGAERYLAERLADPEYRAAYEAAAPAAGDDLRERIARAAACAYMRVPVEAMDPRIIIEPMWPEVADAVLAVLPPQPAPAPDGCEAVFLPTGVVDEFANDTADTITLRDVRVLAACRDACRAAVARRPSQKPPVPPWPGAVLSGLVDEDGQPTWLAQAGQVRGEQVRARTDRGWDDCDGYIATAWVEVRAPLPVLVPETERVNVWDALMNERTAIGYDGTPMELRRGQTILYTRVDGGGGRLMYDDASHPEDKRPLVAPDGTVEVLKDGDR